MICNVCEMFLLIFILLYAFFNSLWILPLIILGILGIFYNLQDKFVYHPQEPAESTCYIEKPSVYNLPHETLKILTSDKIRLHSYLLKQPENLFSSAPTIVFFHGNAGTNLYVF
jgi:hypothetical protein